MKIHLMFLLLVVCSGVGLRGYHLDTPTLFVDEAESAINALTILERGYPNGQYLNLPLFENSLRRPWPEHPEYEFRDSNYSDRGMAVYHSWLPLYSIAASFAACGIGPDVASDPPRVLHQGRETKYRKVAARAPALAYSAVYMIAIFLAGRSFYGRDAGWVALTVVAFAEPCMREGRQARYYSPTLALSMLCILGIWITWRRGRRGDFALATVAFCLLFHTHILSALVAVAVGCLYLPGILRHPGASKRVLTCGVVVLLASVPWMAWTGFLGHVGGIPAARSLMSFPADYLLYFSLDRRACFAIAACGSAVAAVLVLGRWLPERVITPFRELKAAAGFLAAWGIVGYLAFLLLMPASSSFLWRVRVVLEGPAILFMAMGAAACGRVLTRRHSNWVALPILLAVFAVSGSKAAWLTRSEGKDPADAVCEYLGRLEISHGTRLYATPNEHLILSFYSGLPVQSIAPVRRTFLDQYGGDILLVEAVDAWGIPPIPWIKERAAQAGRDLSVISDN